MKKSVTAMNFLGSIVFLMCLVLGWHLGDKHDEMFTYLLGGFIAGSIIEITVFLIGSVYLELAEIKMMYREASRRMGSTVSPNSEYSSVSTMSKLQKINSSSDPKADWICKKCGEKNDGKSMYCKNCGEYK